MKTIYGEPSLYRSHVPSAKTQERAKLPPVIEKNVTPRPNFSKSKLTVCEREVWGAQKSRSCPGAVATFVAAGAMSGTAAIFQKAGIQYDDHHFKDKDGRFHASPPREVHAHHLSRLPRLHVPRPCH